MAPIVRHPPPDDALDVSAAALVFGISENTIYSWIRRRKVESWKQKRGRIVVSRAGIERLLDWQVRHTPSYGPQRDDEAQVT